jgi:hypothetical protein
MHGKVTIVTEKHVNNDNYPMLSNRDEINILGSYLKYQANQSSAGCYPVLVPVYPNEIDDHKINSDELCEIRLRLQLFNKIYDKKLRINEEAHELLGNYRNLLPHVKLNSKKKALSKLYLINPYMRTFVKKIRDAGLDMMIAGSAALSCVWTDAQFMPNDLDVYILDLQSSDIQKFEDVLYQTFDIAYFAVVQNPLTTTFYIQVFSGAIYSIQLNMFNIKSWAQIFVVYHSNITCIGYEILTNRFLYMLNRFDDVLCDKVQYFSNILNFDDENSLANASLKYASRGFHCKYIRIAKKRESQWTNMITKLLVHYYKYQHSMSSTLEQHNQSCSFAGTLGRSLRHNNRVSSISAEFNNQILPIMYLSIYIMDAHVKIGSKYVDMIMANGYFKYEFSRHTQKQYRIFKSCQCNKNLPFNETCNDCVEPSTKNLFII